MKGNKARGAGVEHKGDTVAILNIGRVNRNAQQKTERIYKDVPLASGDLLARIVTLRVHRGPPCMGCFLSSGFRAAHLSLFDLEPVSSPRPAVLQSRRAQELSRLAVAPTLRHTLALPATP